MYIRTLSQSGGTQSLKPPVKAPVHSPSEEDLYGKQVNQMEVLNALRNWNTKYEAIVAEDDDRTASLRHLLRNFKRLHPTFWQTNADTDTEFSQLNLMAMSPYRERQVEAFDDAIGDN